MQIKLADITANRKSLAILLLVFFSKDMARLAGEISKALIGYAGFILFSSPESQRWMFAAAKTTDWIIISTIPLMVFYLGIKLARITTTDTGLSRPRKISTDALLALGIALAILPAIALHRSSWNPLAAFSAIVHISFSSELTNFISLNNWASIFQDRLNPATLLLLGPITEELLCTGLLYSVLRRMFPANTSIIITALSFTLPHSFRLAANIDFFSPTPLTPSIKFYGIGVFALFQFSHSVISCKLKDLRGTIWPAVFLHMFMNFITAYLVLRH